MDCKEFERLIPDFINRKMNYPVLIQFNRHLEECSSCKEELTIQFLVTEGIQRLEEGNAFDLQKELNQRINENRKKIDGRTRALRVGVAMEILGVCLLAGIVIWILL